MVLKSPYSVRIQENTDQIPYLDTQHAVQFWVCVCAPAITENSRELHCKANG